MSHPTPSQIVVQGTDDQARHPRTLVVVFLRGGADGLALVPPVGEDAYHRARPRLRLGTTTALRLDDRFALHPRLAALLPLYRDGALEIVHAVGSDDTTRSHFEAQDRIEHGGNLAGGWIGRFLRARGPDDQAGVGAIAVGTAFPESLRGAPSASVVRSLEELAVSEQLRALLPEITALYGTAPGALGGQMRDAARSAVAALERLASVRASSSRPANGADYPADDFGRGLADIARLIRGRAGVSAATIDLAGWDSHFAQGTVIEPLMHRLARGLAAFRQDLGPSMSSTTVVVMTEFGRRVAENASLGTDHGRGSVMFVLGEGAVGGRVRADWRGLEQDALEGPGDVPVTTDFRTVLAPLLARHGATRLHDVFPGWRTPLGQRRT